MAEYILNDESSIGFYDKCIEYNDCTVQILINSQTQEESVGWRRNEGWHSVYDFCPYEEVICLNTEGTQVIGQLFKIDEDFYACSTDNDTIYNITHWHKLLQPPNITE